MTLTVSIAGIAAAIWFYLKEREALSIVATLVLLTIALLV